MNLKHLLSLLSCLVLTVSFIPLATAVTDAELEVLEKQLEQLETEEIEQAEAEKKKKAEAKRKAEQKRKAVAVAKRKAELEKQRLEEAKQLVEQKRREDEARRQKETEAKKIAEEKLREEQEKKKAKEKLQKLANLSELNKILKKYPYVHENLYRQYSVFSLISDTQLLETSYQQYARELITKQYTLIEVSKLTERVGVLNEDSYKIGVSRNTSTKHYKENAPVLTAKLCDDCSKYTFWPKVKNVDQVDDWTFSGDDDPDNDGQSYSLTLYQVSKEDERIIIEALSEVFD